MRVAQIKLARGSAALHPWLLTDAPSGLTPGFVTPTGSPSIARGVNPWRAVRVALCAILFTGSIASARPDETADEKASIAALTKLGGKASVDPEYPKDGRVTVK